MSQQYQFERPSFQFNPPRMTWAVHWLILLNIAIFAIQVLADPIQFAIFSTWSNSGRIPGGVLNTWFGFQPGLFWTHLVGGVIPYLVWKPITYMFLHGGILHLFMNMLWLFFFGPDVERHLGSREFLRFYLVCGAVAVLTTSLPYVLSGDDPSVIGASGAAMAVLVAFAILFPDRQFFLFPFPFPITAYAMVFIIVVMNLITGLQGGGGVSVATHFGGLAMGLAYMKALPILNRYRNEQRWKKRVRKKPKPPQDPKLDDVGKAVDNIFKFKDPDER